MADTNTEAPRVSVIGLGNMGAALAQAFLNAGLAVTVWNRTSSKAQPLVAAGAKLAPTPAAAAAASPLTVLCAIDMAASMSIYRNPEFSAAIKGRTLADLSTGTAADARSAATWVHAAGGKYLDGGILCYPRDIGKTDAGILYAGDTSAFREHEKTLSFLAGSQEHLGDEPGAAGTVYLALWSFYFGALTAYFEAAALAVAADVPLGRFLTMTDVMIPKLQDGIRDATNRVVERNFAGDQAPITAYVENMVLVSDAFETERLSHLTVTAFLDLLQEAKRAGDGDKDVAAVLARLIARAPAATKS
jgi:3-hydroxyisobutyrate dehydrogenase-like beta-hydroxyacid dehydrogenase